jgi:YNFM family putative membrane transporter
VSAPMSLRSPPVEKVSPTTDGSKTLRTVIVAVMAFLTLVDLFAMQAILPSLIDRYAVSPAAMGVAVNASTVGMALSSLATSFLGHRIDRRTGIVGSLALLAVPTTLLAVAPDLAIFTALRVVQGVFMATAFTLTLAHLGERYMGPAGASAFAAYIAGNVASNFVGRLMSASISDHFGLSITFLVFAGLNIAGAVLGYLVIPRAGRSAAADEASSPLASITAHVCHPQLRANFAIGFLILFAFIGTFTYVNLVLVRPPVGLSMMDVGLVYFVFAPSVATTLWAGEASRRLGVRPAQWLALGLAAAGLPLLVSGSLPLLLAGLTVFAIGTFGAQAMATAHVGRLAQTARGAASGLYLASYFTGGLVGSAVLGQIFERLGWEATVLTIGAALALAAALVGRLGPGHAPQTAGLRRS